MKVKPSQDDLERDLERLMEASSAEPETAHPTEELKSDYLSSLATDCNRSQESL